MTYRCFNVEIADASRMSSSSAATSSTPWCRSSGPSCPTIIKDIDDNAKARVIVISSTGKHFSGGMDLAVFTGGNSAGTAAARPAGERGRVRANLRLGVLDIQEPSTCWSARACRC